MKRTDVIRFIFTRTRCDINTLHNMSNSELAFMLAALEVANEIS